MAFGDELIIFSYSSSVYSFQPQIYSIVVDVVFFGALCLRGCAFLIYLDLLLKLECLNRRWTVDLSGN